MFPPLRRRSNNGRRKGEGKWREEECAIAVPNQEGKAKRQWTVANQLAQGEASVVPAPVIIRVTVKKIGEIKPLLDSWVLCNDVIS